MAIRKYDQDGKTHFLVHVDVRDRTKNLRVQKKTGGFKTEAEARRAERKLQIEAQRELFEKEQEGCTWGSLIKEWEKALLNGTATDRPVQRTTIDDNVRALEIYTADWLGQAAKNISRADVKIALDQVTALGKSASRKKAVKAAIHGCFTWGIEYGHLHGLEQSPAFGIKVLRKETRPPDILNLVEIRTLLMHSKQIEHPWYPIWAMALLTGMRSGELHALLWSDVDFERKQVSVSKSYNNRLNLVKTTKAGYYRDVPISPELETLLKEIKLKAGSREQVLPRFRDWDRGEAARILRVFCRGIGISSVCFHALRACFATQLLRSKVPPAVVMKICGWKELKTMQRYVRLAGLEIEGATNGLNFLSPDEAMGQVIEFIR